jgi:hypothetical protein
MPERGVWAKAAIRIDPRTRTITRAATALAAAPIGSLRCHGYAPNGGRAISPFGTMPGASLMSLAQCPVVIGPRIAPHRSNPWRQIGDEA